MGTAAAATAAGNDDWAGYYNTDYVVAVLLFLFVSYCARIIQLFPSGLDKIRKIGHARLSTFTQSWLLKFKNGASGELYCHDWAVVFTLTVVYTLIMPIYCIFKAATDLYSSMLWEVCSALAKSIGRYSY